MTFLEDDQVGNHDRCSGRTISLQPSTIFKHVVLSMAVTTFLACTPQTEEASGDRARLAHNATILAWAQEQHGEYVFYPVQTFYGDFTGDEVDDALAWILYPSEGNSNLLDVALFRNEGGQMTYYRSIDNVYGGDPRNLVFERGRVTLTTTMPKSGEPRCCPTGSQNWVIDAK